MARPKNAKMQCNQCNACWKAMNRRKRRQAQHQGSEFGRVQRAGTCRRTLCLPIKLSGGWPLLWSYAAAKVPKCSPETASEVDRVKCFC